MVTNAHDENVRGFIGLSTDTKPSVATMPTLKQGSTFYEANTKKLFIYYLDAENEEVWSEIDPTKVNVILNIR